jgi:hypothetical protein
VCLSRVCAVVVVVVVAFVAVVAVTAAAAVVVCSTGWRMFYIKLLLLPTYYLPGAGPAAPSYRRGPCRARYLSFSCARNLGTYLDFEFEPVRSDRVARRVCVRSDSRARAPSYVRVSASVCWWCMSNVSLQIQIICSLVPSFSAHTNGPRTSFGGFLAPTSAGDPQELDGDCGGGPALFAVCLSAWLAGGRPRPRTIAARRAHGGGRGRLAGG